MAFCGNCGAAIEEGKKFCRMCGTPVEMTDEDVRTWRLPPNTSPDPSHPTMPVAPGPTAPPPIPLYTQPPAYYPSVPPVRQQGIPATDHPRISLADWLSGGWRVYKENWLLMSLATLFAGFLSLITVGILAGPLLMGLYRMAFKTMRGERPEMGDLFNFEGRFLQAFLAFLIFALVRGGLSAIAANDVLAALLTLIATPILSTLLGFTMPMILERRVDVANAINEASRLIFSRDALMWWVVGLVFATIAVGGSVACGVGILVTIPWIISSAAIAYRDVFGIEDPNRTLP
jgi:zinc ribbon protein